MGGVAIEHGTGGSGRLREVQQRAVEEWEDDGQGPRTRRRKLLETVARLIPRQRPDGLSPSGAWVDAL